MLITPYFWAILGFSSTLSLQNLTLSAYYSDIEVYGQCRVFPWRFSDSGEKCAVIYHELVDSGNFRYSPGHPNYLKQLRCRIREISIAKADTASGFSFSVDSARINDTGDPFNGQEYWGQRIEYPVWSSRNKYTPTNIVDPGGGNPPFADQWTTLVTNSETMPAKVLYQYPIGLNYIGNRCKQLS